MQLGDRVRFIKAVQLRPGGPMVEGIEGVIEQVGTHIATVRHGRVLVDCYVQELELISTSHDAQGIEQQQGWIP